MRDLPRPLRALAGLAVTALLLGFALREAELGGAIEQVRRARWSWLTLAVLLGPVQFALAGLRWRAIADALGSPMGRREAITEYGLSSLLNQLLPGGVAGDLIRVWRRRPQHGLGRATRAAVLDRWIGLWVHVSVTLCGLWLVAPRTGEAIAVAALFALLCAIPLLPTQLGRQARWALRRAGIAMIGLSVLLTGTFLGAFALCGQALGEPPGTWVVAGVPLVLLAMAVPVSVGGWGLREATAVAILPRFGWSPEGALAVSTLYGLTALVGALPGGIALVDQR